MFYQRSLEIEQRLEAVLAMIRRGGYSTPLIAGELGVSVPTVSRIVCALRERGYRIRAEKQSEGWSYVIEEPARRNSSRPAGELADMRH